MPAFANYRKLVKHTRFSRDNLRASYDRGGKSEVEERVQMDSAALFAMIFGSEKFIPLGVPEIGYSHLAILGYCMIHLTSFFCLCM
jgi:hypothetical protein